MVSLCEILPAAVTAEQHLKLMRGAGGFLVKKTRNHRIVVQRARRTREEEEGDGASKIDRLDAEIRSLPTIYRSTSIIQGRRYGIVTTDQTDSTDETKQNRNNVSHSDRVGMACSGSGSR